MIQKLSHIYSYIEMNIYIFNDLAVQLPLISMLK